MWFYVKHLLRGVTATGTWGVRVRIAITVERVHEIPRGVKMVLDRSSSERPVLWVRDDVPEAVVSSVLEAAQSGQRLALPPRVQP